MTNKKAFNATYRQQYSKCLKITALKPTGTSSGAKRTILLNYSGEDHKPAHSSVSKNLYLLCSYPDYGFNVFIWCISTSASSKQDNTKLILHLSSCWS